MDATRRFTQVIEQHRHQIYTLAYYVLGNAQEAEDVAQEAFIRLWENWREVGSRLSPLPWLIRVTRNLCMDIHRQRRKYNGTFVDPGDCKVLEDSPALGQGPAAATAANETRARLEAAIKNLSEPYRTIVILREVEELTYKEICDAMDLSIEQVKVSLHRARRKLREELMEWVTESES